MTKEKKDGIKRRPVKERVIETIILEWLNYLPGCYAWKNDNTGVYDPARGKFRKVTSKFKPPGVADIIGVYQGRCLCIEVKREGGQPTTAQVSFLRRIAREGGIAGVARSLAEAKELIKHGGLYGIEGVSE